MRKSLLRPQGKGLWLLCRVWMFRRSVNFQFLHDLSAEWSFGQHAPNRPSDELRGLVGQELRRRTGGEAPWEQGVVVVLLALPFAPGQFDLVRIDHNHKVTGVNVGGKRR